jgi:hypothetical protein
MNLPLSTGERDSATVHQPDLVYDSPATRFFDALLDWFFTEVESEKRKQPRQPQ